MSLLGPNFLQLPALAKVYGVSGFFPGNPSGIVAYEYALSYNSAGTVNLLNMLYACRIVRATVVVTTPFNGTAPTVSIGVSGTLSKFVSATDVDLTVAEQFEVDGDVSQASAAQMIATYTSGSSTAGAARIIVWAQENERARTIHAHTFERAVKFTAGLTGSFADSDIRPVSNTTFTIYNGVTSVGTLTVLTSGPGTFSFASDVTFNAGDKMRIVSPAALNGMADMSFALKGLEL